MPLQNAESASSKRPLSPHLQVYKPQITSVMSILHRITGAGLVLGLFMFMWFIGALAIGPDLYKQFVGFSSSFLGIILIAGFVFALSYHFCNGIRHLLWDIGYGYDLDMVTKTGLITICATVLISLFVIIAILL